MMTVGKAVALRICELLREKNMTQYRLEVKSGLSHSRVGNTLREKNKTVTLSTIILLAQGFDMTLLEFLNSDYFNSDTLEVE